RRILPPVVGIDINEIEDNPRPVLLDDIGEHCRRKYVDYPRFMLPDDLTDTRPEPRVSKIAFGQGRASQKTAETPNCCKPGVELLPKHIVADRFEVSNFANILGSIDEGRQVNAVLVGEVPQDIPGADFITLIRRIGDTVR